MTDLIKVKTPIGDGILVGRLRMKDQPEKMLVSYRASVMEHAVSMGFEAFAPYCGGPSVLFAWTEDRVTL